MSPFSPALPIDGVLPEITAALSRHQILILVAEPGASIGFLGPRVFEALHDLGGVLAYGIPVTRVMSALSRASRPTTASRCASPMITS